MQSSIPFLLLLLLLLLLLPLPAQFISLDISRFHSKKYFDWFPWWVKKWQKTRHWNISNFKEKKRIKASQLGWRCINLFDASTDSLPIASVDVISWRLSWRWVWMNSGRVSIKRNRQSRCDKFVNYQLMIINSIENRLHTSDNYFLSISIRSLQLKHFKGRSSKLFDWLNLSLVPFRPTHSFKLKYETRTWFENKKYFRAFIWRVRWFDYGVFLRLFTSFKFRTQVANKPPESDTFPADSTPKYNK